MAHSSAKPAINCLCGITRYSNVRRHALRPAARASQSLPRLERREIAGHSASTPPFRSLNRQQEWRRHRNPRPAPRANWAFLCVIVQICALGVRWGRMLFLSEQSQLCPLELTNLHATTLTFPPAAARAGLVAAGLADGLRDGGFGVRLRGRFGVRAALERERGVEAHGGGGLRIGQDGLDCAERLARERPGLLAPSEVLVAAGFDEGIAKSGRTQ